MKEYPVTCFCGSHAVLASNSIVYGREYGNGKAYICSRFPECDGMVGTHPTGKPLGTMIDKETRQLRRAVHAEIDPLWRTQERSKKRARGSVYGWLRRILDMTAEECHVGNFDADTCKRALEAIKEHPYEVHA